MQDYELVENEKISDKIAIKLIGGEFDGMIYLYGEVGASVIENDKAKLKFNYEVVKNPNQYDHENSEEFECTIGNILVTLIDEHLIKDDREDNINEFSD
jgi:hypothetical protein